MTDATLPFAPEAERQQRLAAERTAIDRLARVNGALELQAAVLALLLPRGSQRALRAWQIETTGAPEAEAVRGQIDALSGQSRLPMFEQLVGPDDRILMTAHGPAHVAGSNAGVAGLVSRCVGCHLGHSTLPVGTVASRAKARGR